MRRNSPFKQRAVFGLQAAIAGSLLLLMMSIALDRTFLPFQGGRFLGIAVLYHSLIIGLSILSIMGINRRNKRLALGCGTVAGVLICMYSLLGLAVGLACLVGLHNQTFVSTWFDTKRYRSRGPG